MFPIHLFKRLAVIVAVSLVVAVAGISYLHFKTDGGLPDSVALKVDGTDVSKDTVASRMKALQALYGVKAPTNDKERRSFQRDTTKSLALEQMLEDAAKKKKIEIPDKSVDVALTDLITEKYSDGGKAAFVKALGDMGASEDQVKDEIRQQMLVARLFDDVTAQVRVSDGEVLDAFKTRQKDLAKPEQRTVRNIVVQTRADATKVLRALASGTGFAAAARQSSLDGATRDKGGLLGTVVAEDLDPTYAAAAFAARAGVPFGPVKTQYGWNVGLVEKVVASKAATLAGVTTTLKATLVKEKSIAVWSDWLKKLVAHADVDYASAYRPSDPDSIPALAGTESGN
jgi:peptidyl-prolyl cis-trans isomerase C